MKTLKNQKLIDLHTTLELALSLADQITDKNLEGEKDNENYLATWKIQKTIMTAKQNLYFHILGQGGFKK